MHKISPELAQDLRSKGADLERTLRILELINMENPQDSAQKLIIPQESDPRIEDRVSSRTLTIDADRAYTCLKELNLPEALLDSAGLSGSSLILNEACLTRIGISLYPRVAYGVLNGGSATSYADIAKNEALSPRAFELLKHTFNDAASAAEGAPKGTTSAYFERDGRPGPSFLLLKMRSLLIHALEYRLLTGNYETKPLPFFQMTSQATDAPLKAAYEKYRSDPLVKDLINKTGVDPSHCESAVQGLIGALSPSSAGLPRRIFDAAGGRPESALALPGGHGENFRILADIYRKLQADGIRWAYLGNVDNSGYTVDSVAIAILALRGANAAFEFSWKTSVDRKGGVLVQGPNGRLSVADIGQAISQKELDNEEECGKRVLFNCATGLFNLDYLVPRLEYIADALPIRVSDQEKEAGNYAQAEQTTWEVLGLMENPLIFAVSKERRFVAAKTLMETLLASPISAKLETAQEIDASLRADSMRLRRGLEKLLNDEYGFTLGADQRRRPLTANELEAALQKNGPSAL